MAADADSEVPGRLDPRTKRDILKTERVLDEVAKALGYDSGGFYNSDCESNPAKVRKRIRNLKAGAKT